MKYSFDHIFKLSNGRKISYAELGDPKGKPIFAFHGWPSSRLHALRFAEAAKKVGARIIAPDRPGYGLSDFVKNRKLLDFPDDILELADHLKINKFAIMGVSGGGPYAAVCAFKIPKRVTVAGIVVGLGPTSIKGILKAVSWVNRFGWSNFGRFPILSDISSFLGWLETNVLHTYTPTFLVSSVDRKLVDTNFRKMSQQSREEAFLQGFKAASQDLKIYSRKWGFDLRKIKIPVFLWYGEKDENVSLEMGKYFAKQIPKSKLTIYPGEGHYCQITHAEEILSALLKNNPQVSS